MDDLVGVKHQQRTNLILVHTHSASPLPHRKSLCMLLIYCLIPLGVGRAKKMNVTMLQDNLCDHKAHHQI